MAEGGTDKFLDSYFEAQLEDAKVPEDSRGITQNEKHYRDLGKTHRYPHENLTPSKYAAVDVLLIRWAADDLGVISEIGKLEKVFKIQYNFSTTHCVLPNEDAEDHLTREICNFRKGKGLNHLLILYYAGHAGGDPSECIWAANRSDDTPTLNFHSVQGLLLGHKADFLGSSTKESPAAGVSQDSFTSALIRALKRHAQRYWADNTRFTLQSIHSTLIVWDRDLKFTPSIVRLSEHECDATELTPLLPRSRPSKLNPSNTTPDYNSALASSSGTLPSRPKGKASLPTDSLPVSGISEDQSNGSILPVDLKPGEFHTVRLSGLPPLTDSTDVSDWFEDRLDQSSIISRIGPLGAPSSNETVVTFKSVAVAKQAMAIRNKRFRAKAGGGRLPITIDSHFQGLTCIYSSETPVINQLTVDLIFVHGANGHPINSFASHSIAPSTEFMWPCDELPKVLETAGIFPRILTFGWNADVWLEPGQDTDKACRSFVEALAFARKEVLRRPVVFFGHGVGGLLIKQAVGDIISFGFNEENFENPIKACFFFSVPHHGLNGTDNFATILANMKSGLSNGVPPDSKLVRSLEPLNAWIEALSTQFLELRSEYSFSTVSFFEQESSASHLVVPEESAILDQKSGKAYAINAVHQKIAQLPESSRDLGLVLDVVCDTIGSKLGQKLPTTSTQSNLSAEVTLDGTTEALSGSKSEAPKVNKEKVYARLKRYDTVFLVDDSDSMYGQRWTTTSQVLAEIAKIAVKYDTNGVDIRFFNENLEESERKNLDSSVKIMSLFKKVIPEGPTLTANILDEELSDYMAELRSNWNRKGLNLIVLTDGEPEPGQKVEEIIVKYAKKLEKMEASEFKVGIQFVQIGSDENARKFLQSLDDDLMEKHGLDRDMVDTVLWEEGHEDNLYEKILLGGVLKRLDNKNEANEDT
ncbi:hypothetical protein MMC18_007810 [Xylographa bjoerkii]|nr:hypothetical protein [Xylographa bjoerkii]